jgi:hypothetical protein
MTLRSKLVHLSWAAESLHETTCFLAQLHAGEIELQSYTILHTRTFGVRPGVAFDTASK